MEKRVLCLILCVALLTGFLTLPAAAEDAITVADAGYVFGDTLAAEKGLVSVIKEDGSLWTWGGLRTFDRDTPLSYLTEPHWMEDLPPVVSVTHGDYYTMAITADGELWNWGTDSFGRLGREQEPYCWWEVPGKLMDHVRAVSAGFDHSVALTEDGTLWAWGCNDYGQLGSGGTGTQFRCIDDELIVYETLPVKVMTDVVAVSAGDRYTAAIKSDGSLWTWGLNDKGQLGNGGVGNAEGRLDLDGVRPVIQTVPVKVMDGVAQVCASVYQTAVIKTDGSLWVWGGTRLTEDSAPYIWDEEEGVYLFDTETMRTEVVHTPEKIMDDVIQISTDGGSFAAVKSDGSLWTWGINYFGVLGRGSDAVNLEGREVPQKLMDGVASAVVGWNAMAALRYDGSLWTWGWNVNGQLGNGTQEDSSVPIKIMDGVALPGSVSKPMNTEPSAALSLDGAAVDAAGSTVSIPDTAFFYNNHAYQYYEGAATWDQAEAFCESMGGHLAVITSAEELNYVASNNKAPRWTGGRRDSRGVWSWVNGERWSFTAWNDGEPNNDGGKEDCLILWPVKWNDLPAYVANPEGGFLCEWDYVPGREQPVPSPAPLPTTTPSNGGSSFRFDANGGSVGIQSVTVTQGKAVGPLPVPKRDGYTFDGWYTEPDGGAPITEFVTVTHLGEQKIYAHWVANRAQPTVADLSFSFVNSRKSFGYPQGFRFPMETFRYFFGDSSYAQQCYDSYTLWGGSCWGMSMTASLIQSVNEISLSSFRSGAKHPTDLQWNDYSNAAKTSLYGMIELGQVSQMSSPISKVKSRNMNQIGQMVQEVLAYQNTGNHPVIVSIKGPRDQNGSRDGHAMVAYAVYRDPAESFDRMMVYDPNFPGNGARFVALFRDASDNYTGWYYHLNDAEDWGSGYDSANITYTTYDVYYPIWLYRGWTDYQSGTVTINSPNASILDYAGNPVAQIRDGALISERPDVFPLTWDEGESSGGEITVFLPREYYQIVNEDETVKELRVTMTNGAHSASVTTGNNRVLCYSDEQGGVDAVMVDSGGAPYEIVLRTDAEEITLSGSTYENAPCFLAMTGDTLQASGVSLTDSSLTRDGSKTDATELTSGSIVSVVSALQPAVVTAEFNDLDGEAYYTPAVRWALDRGVTEGMAPGTFSPEGICTRAQAMTFLWRALGQPEPTLTTAPFGDLDESAYYYKAVLWALGAGITAGTDEAHFSPDALCTNAHILTFLWRASGEPMKTETGSWYDDALRWAESSGIADDAPSNSLCSRSDAVTFLFRALA